MTAKDANITICYMFAPYSKTNFFSFRSSQQRCSAKKVFLKVSQKSKQNTCARASFLIKFQAASFIKKDTLTQVFSCESCEIFKNTIFYRTPLMAASEALGSIR